MIVFHPPALIAPNGSIVGVIQQGEGMPEPSEIGTGDLILEHPLATADALTRLREISRYAEMRRGGAALVLISHDEALLEECADEIWWLRGHELIARGYPSKILPLYRKHVAEEWRASGAGRVAAVAPSRGDGDGRATLQDIRLLTEGGVPTTVWNSGELTVIQVVVRFAAAVEDPVVGILIRTRIGLNVYGTNTGLEQLHPGPVAPGDILTVTFRFRCDLCPGDYTLTAASHDPDGVWHDWREDAVAFAVADSRYTAGVANLRAHVSAEVSRG